MKARMMPVWTATILIGMTGMAFTNLPGQVVVKSGPGTIECKMLKGSTISLEINEYRGTLQWQQSADGNTWTNCPGGTLATYQCAASGETWLRVAVQSENCDPVYSDRAHVRVYTLPLVATADPTDITLHEAKSGGRVNSDGGDPVTDRGVCWSTATDPTLDNAESVTHDGDGTGAYTSTLTGLSAGTQYFVRAFATNGGGTKYGKSIQFHTVPETGTFKDSRDNQEYQWVRIGTQTWMARNLAWLPAVSPSTEGSSTVKHYYVYDYSGTDTAAAKATANYTKYGVLYNWTASMEACPAGWHLPGQEDLSILSNYLIDKGYGYGGSGDDVGKAMASTSGWIQTTRAGDVGWNQAINNSSGFNALPGGWADLTDKTFKGIEWCGSFGSAEIDLSDAVHVYCIINDVARIFWEWDPKNMGLSVRCVKD